VAKEISDAVGDSCLILDVEMDLLRVCSPILMVVILQFSLCMHEPHWIMISVDDCPVLKNVISPLEVGFHNAIHFFVISRVLKDNI
jgi:hypothetical protein